MLDNNALEGTYGTMLVRKMRETIQRWMPVAGKNILVVGSSMPWIEVILLSENVANITTLDYNPVKTNHPKIKTLSPRQMSKLISDDLKPSFDGVISFSSIEHSGLGRQVYVFHYKVFERDHKWHNVVNNIYIYYCLFYVF